MFEWGIDSLRADSLIKVNVKVTTVDSLESLWKEVNELALKYVLPKDTLLDSTNRAKLIDIAELCPLYYGPAVYQARALLCSEDNDPRIALNDCENPSLPQPPSQRLAQPEEEEEQSVDVEELAVFIYPNPNQGDLTVKIVGGEDESSYQLNVLDLLGKQVFNSRLSLGLNNVTLPLSAGTYLYTIIQDDGEVVEQGNVVVMQE